jgi:lipid-A-disaccharide synthase
MRDDPRPSHWESSGGRASLFVSTGSTSADVLLAPVLAELRRRNRLGRLVGLGGTLLREHGVELFFETTGIPSVGVVARLPTLVAYPRGAARAYRMTARYFRDVKPALVILVDNPGQNLRLLSLAHACRIPTLYYVPPETWGVTRWQVRAIARKASAIVSVLRAEGDAYAAQGGDVRWVGHPTGARRTWSEHRAIPRKPPAGAGLRASGSAGGRRDHPAGRAARPVRDVLRE